MPVVVGLPTHQNKISWPLCKSMLEKPSNVTVIPVRLVFLSRTILLNQSQVQSLNQLDVGFITLAKQISVSSSMLIKVLDVHLLLNSTHSLLNQDGISIKQVSLMVTASKQLIPCTTSNFTIKVSHLAIQCLMTSISTCN